MPEILLANRACSIAERAFQCVGIKPLHQLEVDRLGFGLFDEVEDIVLDEFVVGIKEEFAKLTHRERLALGLLELAFLLLGEFDVEVLADESGLDLEVLVLRFRQIGFHFPVVFLDLQEVGEDDLAPNDPVIGVMVLIVLEDKPLTKIPFLGQVDLVFMLFDVLLDLL